MKLVLLIVAVLMFLLLFLLCLVDASFCTLRHVVELSALGFAFFSASFLPYG